MSKCGAHNIHSGSTRRRLKSFGARHATNTAAKHRRWRRISISSLTLT